MIGALEVSYDNAFKDDYASLDGAGVAAALNIVDEVGRIAAEAEDTVILISRCFSAQAETTDSPTIVSESPCSVLSAASRWWPATRLPVRLFQTRPLMSPKFSSEQRSPSSASFSILRGLYGAAFRSDMFSCLIPPKVSLASVFF